MIELKKLRSAKRAFELYVRAFRSDQKHTNETCGCSGFIFNPDLYLTICNTESFIQFQNRMMDYGYDILFISRESFITEYDNVYDIDKEHARMIDYVGVLKNIIHMNYMKKFDIFFVDNYNTTIQSNEYIMNTYNKIKDLVIEWCINSTELVLPRDKLPSLYSLMQILDNIMSNLAEYLMQSKYDKNTYSVYNNFLDSLSFNYNFDGRLGNWKLIESQNLIE